MEKCGTKARPLLFWAQQSRIGNFGKGMKECSHDGSVPKKEQRADAGRERVGESFFLIMALRNGIVRQQTAQVGQFRAERKREGGRYAWREISRAEAEKGEPSCRYGGSGKGRRRHAERSLFRKTLVLPEDDTVF